MYRKSQYLRFLSTLNLFQSKKLKKKRNTFTMDSVPFTEILTSLSRTIFTSRCRTPNTHAHTHTCTNTQAHTLTLTRAPHSVLHRNISPNSLHPSAADAALAVTYPGGISRNYERRQKRGAFGPHYSCVPPTHTHFGYKCGSVAIYTLQNASCPPHPPHRLLLSELACNLDDPAK